MFKVDLIRFNHADEFQEYKFSEHSFVYGKMLWSSFFVTLRPNFCHRVYATP